jgi:hypothetical protein
MPEPSGFGALSGCGAPYARLVRTRIQQIVILRFRLGCNVASSSLHKFPSSEGSEEVVILAVYESGAVELCACVRWVGGLPGRGEQASRFDNWWGCDKSRTSAVAYLTWWETFAPGKDGMGELVAVVRLSLPGSGWSRLHINDFIWWTEGGFMGMGGDAVEGFEVQWVGRWKSECGGTGRDSELVKMRTCQWLY